jgi:hypothetical protein
MGNISPPRTLCTAARDGDSETRSFAVALPFLRSKVLGGDHGGVLDTDLGVPPFFAGVFRGEGDGLGLALGFEEGTKSRVFALRGGV